MAVQPGTYDIMLQRRADYSVLLQFKDSNDAVINLTGIQRMPRHGTEGRDHEIR